MQVVDGLLVAGHRPVAKTIVSVRPRSGAGARRARPVPGRRTRSACEPVHSTSERRGRSVSRSRGPGAPRRRRPPQLAEALGDLHVAPHRAAEQRHACGRRRRRRGSRGRCGRCGARSTSRWRGPARSGRAPRAARPSCPRSACGPGAAAFVESAKQGEHAVAPERAEPRAVGAGAAIVLAVVELVVAREDDRPDRRLDRQRRRVGDGVGDADVLDREGAGVTRCPGTADTSGGSGTSASASLARTSSMVNGRPDDLADRRAGADQVRAAPRCGRRGRGSARRRRSARRPRARRPAAAARRRRRARAPRGNPTPQSTTTRSPPHSRPASCCGRPRRGRRSA